MSDQAPAALVIGVADYSKHKPPLGPLPLCRNDAEEISDTLHTQLFIPTHRITTLAGTVIASSFCQSLDELVLASPPTAVIYFSGHGWAYDGEHYLAFTDSLIPTRKIIEKVTADIPSALFIIDSCYSGAAQPQNNLASIESASRGHGCCIIASSKPDQLSGFKDGADLSVLTYYLRFALGASYSKSRGEVDLDTIEQVLKLLMNRHNANPDITRQQQLVIKHAQIGTMHFPNPDHKPYQPAAVEPRRFGPLVLREVSSFHTGNRKRLSLKTTTDSELELEALVAASAPIFDYANTLHVYPNEKAERRLKREPVAHITLHVYADDADLANGNHICQLAWVDPVYDREYWYRHATSVFGDIAYFENASYDHIHKLIAENALEDPDAVDFIFRSASEINGLAESIFGWLDELDSDFIDEGTLIDHIAKIRSKASEAYNQAVNCGFGSLETEPFLDALIGLAGDLHDLILFYTTEEYLSRTPENRHACADLTRKRYHRNLDALIDALFETFGSWPRHLRCQVLAAQPPHP